MARIQYRASGLSETEDWLNPNGETPRWKQLKWLINKSAGDPICLTSGTSMLADAIDLFLDRQFVETR